MARVTVRVMVTVTVTVRGKVMVKGKVRVKVRVKGMVRVKGKVMVMVRVMVTVRVRVMVKVMVKGTLTTIKEEIMNEILKEQLQNIIETLHTLDTSCVKSDDHILSTFLTKNVFIRTVTHHYTGKALCIKDGFLMLKDCAWIADDGRFSTALSKGVFEEVEPFPDGLVFIGLGSILDVSEWMHELPRKQK